MDYAVKVVLAGVPGQELCLERQKTMYGGRKIAAGDRIFVFDSETAGGSGLAAWGIVSAAIDAGREGTPRVTVVIAIRGQVRRRFGRAEARGFATWDDGRPETEINFKFYRQATDKLVGISPEAAAFLAGHF